MITIKTPEQIELLKEAGKIHATILDEIEMMVAPGVNAMELNDRAYELVKAAGAEPSFLNYQPDPSYPKYPASLCVSINDVVVHGIPKEDMVLQEGDLVSFDLGIEYKGVFTDAARTMYVGDISKTSTEIRNLLSRTQEALARGIEAAMPGNTVGDIGHAIESFNHDRYGNVHELAGHGTGLAVHEDPYVPNFGKAGTGATLKPGMVLAIEPMFTLGTSDVVFDADKYTARTADGSLAAHFEHTIVITDGFPEIVTAHNNK